MLPTETLYKGQSRGKETRLVAAKAGQAKMIAKGAEFLLGMMKCSKSNC
jgi:hypothetical protein